MDAITSLEPFFLVGSVAAALAAALWSGSHGLLAVDARKTGELIWALVAGATLAAVLLAAYMGPLHAQ